MTVKLGSIELPADLQWVDEFQWLPVAQRVDVASNGALIVEESAQLAGRPITLQGRAEDRGFAPVTRQVVKQLHALAAVPLTAPVLLELEDGRTFNVRFRYADGAAVEATPMRHIAPHDDADLYSLTLRLMQV